VVTGDPRPLEEIEKRYVRHVLGQLGGRRVEAARVLGLSYPTFLKRLED
jgi:DNA-binding NtrC family response regulator